MRSLLGSLSIIANIIGIFSGPCTDFKDYKGCEQLEMVRVMRKPSFFSKDISFAPHDFNDAVVEIPSDDTFININGYFFMSDTSGSHITCLNTGFVHALNQRNPAFGLISPQYAFPTPSYDELYYLTFYVTAWIKLKSIKVLFPVLIGCPGTVEALYFESRFAGIIGDDLMAALNTTYHAGVPSTEIPYPLKKNEFVYFWNHPITKDIWITPHEFPTIDIYSYGKVGVEISEAFWSTPFYFGRLPYLITKKQMRALIMAVMNRESVTIKGSWKRAPQSFTVSDDEMEPDEQEKLFENVLSKITPKKSSIFDHPAAPIGYEMTPEQEQEFAKMMEGNQAVTSEKGVNNSRVGRRKKLHF